MSGLLADVNVQGHLPYLKRLMEVRGLLDVLTGLEISLMTFPELGLERDIDDRTLWHFCQENDLILFTDNRNYEDDNSLSAVLQDSWHVGHFPVLTLANKRKFENDAAYATQVADDVAEMLVTAFIDETRDQPRIFVPL